MKNSLTLLAIEDSAHHIQDLKEMLSAEIPRLPLQLNVLFATNLKEAMSLIDQVDIVMTDIFFPAEHGGDAMEPNGKKIVEHCLLAQKSVVWVTSTYHHGDRTQALWEWSREHGVEMFDCEEISFVPDDWFDRDEEELQCELQNRCNGEGQHKHWRWAFLKGLLKYRWSSEIQDFIYSA